MPRSRGAFSGTLVVLLGIWGALIPFVGPYFNFTIGPTDSWDWTSGRLWLNVIPGVAAIVGGLWMLGAKNRASAATGAWLALAAGAWFVIGPAISQLWNSGVPDTGAAFGGNGRRTLEQLTWFYGLGAAITALSAFALGRFSLTAARDVERLAEQRDPERHDGDGARDRRFFRRRHREEPLPAGETERTAAYRGTRE